MPDVTSLDCPRCGGPLRPPAPPGRWIPCIYCGASLALTPERALPAAPPPSDVVSARRQAFQAALIAHLNAGIEPFAALTEAARGPLELGRQAEAAATVALHLVADFEREARVSVRHEPLVLARVVEAYLRALDTLGEAASATLDLPFLTADASGPKHLHRTVTAAEFRRLAAAPLAPPAPPRRGCWPFG